MCHIQIKLSQFIFEGKVELGFRGLLACLTYASATGCRDTAGFVTFRPDNKPPYPMMRSCSAATSFFAFSLLPSTPHCRCQQRRVLVATSSGGGGTPLFSGGVSQYVSGYHLKQCLCYGRHVRRDSDSFPARIGDDERTIIWLFFAFKTWWGSFLFPAVKGSLFSTGGVDGTG